MHVWFKPADSPVSPYKSRTKTQNMHHPWPALYVAASVFGHPHMHKNAPTQYICHQRPWSWHCCHYFTKIILSNKGLFLVCMFVSFICGGSNKWKTTTGIIAVNWIFFLHEIHSYIDFTLHSMIKSKSYEITPKLTCGIVEGIILLTVVPQSEIEKPNSRGYQQL